MLLIEKSYKRKIYEILLILNYITRKLQRVQNICKKLLKQVFCSLSSIMSITKKNVT